MKNSMVTLQVVSAVLALLVFNGSANANNKPVSITSQVNELVKQLDSEGKIQLVATSPENIVPGDRVLYTTRFQNNSAENSDNISITNSIPEQVRYLAGTAQGENCDIVFSINGGQKWGKPEQLKVRMADGQLRTAQASEYTHIRWQYQSALAAQQSGQISYQALLK